MMKKAMVKVGTRCDVVDKDTGTRRLQGIVTNLVTKGVLLETEGQGRHERYFVSFADLYPINTLKL